MSERDCGPSETDLARIEQWPHADLPGWFAFIKSLWWAPEWGGWREDVVCGRRHEIVRYSISTGGMSDNEVLIGAMQKNALCWSLTWRSTRRGGHYVFERLRTEAERAAQPVADAVRRS